MPVCVLILIKLSRKLIAYRQKLQSYLKDVLVEFPVSKEWASEGRFCCPRVLFVVEMRRSLNSDLVTSPSSPDVPVSPFFEESITQS